MSRFQFELATADDDQAIQSLLAEAIMPGSVSVTFRREPSFFQGAVVDGPFRQVMIARDTKTGQVGGLGCRSVRTMYVNGQARPVGYLSSLRILEPYRNARMLARGYAFLRKLHGDGRTDLYLTTIAAGNDRAVNLLTSRRAGLPNYVEAGKFWTFVIPLRRPLRAKPSPSISVRPLETDNIEALSEFLTAEGPRRQFFPAYFSNEFFGEKATFKDLQPNDVLVAYRDGEIVGTLGAWNQRAFRQTVIEGYTGHLRWLRGLHNGWARLLGRPPLPAPGGALRHVMAALPLVRDDNTEVFVALLRSLVNQLAARSHDFLLVGLHEDDPLLPAARRFAVNAFVTRLYLVSWGDEFREKLDGRAPYLELGCL